MPVLPRDCDRQLMATLKSAHTCCPHCILSGFAPPFVGVLFGRRSNLVLWGQGGFLLQHHLHHLLGPGQCWRLQVCDCQAQVTHRQVRHGQRGCRCLVVFLMGHPSFNVIIPCWHLEAKVGRGKGDHLSKAPVKDALLVGSCQLWCGWDSWAVLGDTLPLIRSDDDVRIVSLCACTISPSLGQHLAGLGHDLDGKWTCMVDWQICLDRPCDPCVSDQHARHAGRAASAYYPPTCKRFPQGDRNWRSETGRQPS